MADKTGKTAESFEAFLARLEEIVQQMEHGGLPLEQAMKLYEEGIVMADRLSVMLATSREKVMKLVENQNGESALEPFERNGEDE